MIALVSYKLFFKEQKHDLANDFLVPGGHDCHFETTITESFNVLSLTSVEEVQDHGSSWLFFLGGGFFWGFEFWGGGSHNFILFGQLHQYLLQFGHT